jgi:hypothetical protein
LYALGGQAQRPHRPDVERRIIEQRQMHLPAHGGNVGLVEDQFGGTAPARAELRVVLREGKHLADDRPFWNGKLAFSPHAAHHVRLPRAGTFNDAYASNIFWRSLWTHSDEGYGRGVRARLELFDVAPPKIVQEAIANRSRLLTKVSATSIG